MDEQARRRAFREFVRTYHPDVGGDPAVFAAGVAAYRSGRPIPAPRPLPSLRPDDPRLDAELVFRRTHRGPFALIDYVARRRARRRRAPRVR